MPDVDCEYLKSFPCSCAKGESCLLKSSHSRLREAHRHWHAALERYSDLDGMRTYLNGTIQALRNVTFTLQSAKGEIPNFEQWYGAWQTAFRADPIMRWAVDSRNRVVKDSDLETRSLAHVELVGSASGEIMMKLEAPPSSPNVTLAAQLMRRLMRQHPPTDSMLRGGMLKVERRWVDSQLPNTEVMDALVHVFGRLARLLVDCHRHLQVPEVCGWPEPRTAGAKQDGPLLPACMIAFEDRRTAWIRMSNGEEVGLESRRIMHGPKYDETVRKRYSEDSRKSFRDALLATSLSERAQHLWKIAKHMMETDGYHIPMVWLFRDSSLVWQGALQIPDNAFKHVLWDDLRRNVERSGATELAIASEGWKAPHNPAIPDQRAEDSPDRQETLSIDTLNSKGESFTLMAMVDRVDGRAVVREPEQLETKAFYLDPIRRAWGLPQTQDDDSKGWDIA